MRLRKGLDEIIFPRDTIFSMGVPTLFWRTPARKFTLGGVCLGVFYVYGNGGTRAWRLQKGTG